MSYTNLLYHIVYARKERAPLITQTLRPRLHEYPGGTVRGLGGIPIEINFLSGLKSSSSGWARRQTKGRFAWQARYGAFSVSQSQAGRVREYIRNQEKHHSKISFEEEFKALLRGNGVDFDEAHLWG